MVFLELLRQYGIFRIVPYCRNNSQNTILSEQFSKYHTVGTILKIPYCRNNSKNTISMVFLELFRQYGIFRIVLTVWYFQNFSDSMVFLELLRLLIKWKTKHTILSEQFWKYHTVGTILKIPYCRNNSKNTILWYFQNCSDSMVFLELFRQYGMFCFSFY
jgi:hypothetical protein